MSCCGCRALRKGCSEDCTLRPCLQWIKSPQSQAHATIFLAKFYGRAGLINLINAGPSHLRTEIFKSLLYEACGRIINPVYGSVGLITSNNWARCQAAVKTVLEGGDINPNSFRGGDIRHVNKDTVVDRPIRTRNRFKRSTRNRSINDYDSLLAELDDHNKFTITGWNCTEQHDPELERAQSHDGSFSVETDAQEPAARWALVKPESVELELTLGFNAVIDLSDSE